MGSDAIWQTDALQNPHLSPHKMLGFDRVGTAGEEVDTTQDLHAGRPVESDRLPVSLFLKDERCDLQFLPDYFSMTFPCVSQRLADFLQGFDIGDSRFLPIDIVQSDRRTVRPDRFYILNIVSQKSCWVREDSYKLSSTWIAEDHWLFMFAPGDDLLAVRASATEGADLWVDPVLQGAMFVSDRLYQAWKATTMMPPMMEFYRCKLVD